MLSYIKPILLKYQRQSESKSATSLSTTGLTYSLIYAYCQIRFSYLGKYVFPLVPSSGPSGLSRVLSYCSKKACSQRSSGDSGETLQLSDWSLIIEVPSSAEMCLPCVGQRGEHILHVTSHVVLDLWNVLWKIRCYVFLFSSTVGNNSRLDIVHAHSLFLSFPGCFFSPVYALTFFFSLSLNSTLHFLCFFSHVNPTFFPALLPGCVELYVTHSSPAALLHLIRSSGREGEMEGGPQVRQESRQQNKPELHIPARSLASCCRWLHQDRYIQHLIDSNKKYRKVPHSKGLFALESNLKREQLQNFSL